MTTYKSEGYGSGGSSGSAGGGSVTGGGLPGFLSRGGVRREDAPTLTDNLRGRYGPTERYNIFHAVGSTTPSAQWLPITVDRPTILYPCEQLVGSVYARPFDSPVPAGTVDLLVQSQHGFGPGILFLSAPGRWYLHYHAAARADWLQIAVDDPVLAAAFLSEPGFAALNTGNGTTSAVINTVTDLLAANPRRRGLYISQGSNGGATIALAFGVGATPSAVPPFTGYLIVGNGSSLTLTGTFLGRGLLRIAASIASANYTYTETE